MFLKIEFSSGTTQRVVLLLTGPAQQRRCTGRTGFTAQIPPFLIHFTPHTTRFYCFSISTLYLDIRSAANSKKLNIRRIKLAIKEKQCVGKKLKGKKSHFKLKCNEKQCHAERSWIVWDCKHAHHVVGIKKSHIVCKSFPRCYFLSSTLNLHKLHSACYDGKHRTVLIVSQY